MDYAAESLRLHREWRGKIEVTPRAKVDSSEALSLAYTPGVRHRAWKFKSILRKASI
jgi:malate dehydrogenase (oxaloacetate-decarboxylating)